MSDVFIHSDFSEPYDYWFETYHPDKVNDDDIVFERFMRQGPTRREMFEMMTEWELDVIPHGLAGHLYCTEKANFERRFQNSKVYWDWDELTQFVIYLDERSHVGADKIKVCARKAFLDYPDRLASIYMPTTAHNGSISMRHLQIGNLMIWLQYESVDDWRSNCGDVTVTVTSGPIEKINTYYNRPLFAIDFVLSGRLYAIDFNMSPGVEPVLSVMDSHVIAHEIKTRLISSNNK